MRNRAFLIRISKISELIQRCNEISGQVSLGNLKAKIEYDNNSIQLIRLLGITTNERGGNISVITD